MAESVAMQLLEFLGPKVRRIVAEQAADIIEHASSFGSAHWGVTPYPDGVLRVNVGWTEILTADSTELRLIVDGERARAVKLSGGVMLVRGSDERGYYPSVPGSVCIYIPYGSPASLKRILAALRPAVMEAVRLAARRASGRGVKAGHSQEAQSAVSRLVGRALPTPSYAKDASEPATSAAERMEGALRRVVGSKYERNPAARRSCIEHYGAVCFVCGFSFELAYGEIGRGFIHVHHLTPLSAQGVAHRVNPIRDLRPVCPNCHAMLHSVDPPLTIKKLQKQMAGANNP